MFQLLKYFWRVVESSKVRGLNISRVVSNVGVLNIFAIMYDFTGFYAFVKLNNLYSLHYRIFESGHKTLRTYGQKKEKGILEWQKQALYSFFSKLKQKLRR